jgi:hypothetical protein
MSLGLESILSRMPTRPFLNNAGADIPPFSLIAKASDLTVKDGIVLEEFTKASATFVREYAVTNHLVTKSGKPGRYQTGPIVIVKYDSSATPADGDGFGAKPDDWAAYKNYPQCLIVRGIISSEKKLMLAHLIPIGGMFALANGSIAAGASGAISIHQGVIGSTTAIPSMDPTAINASETLDVVADDPLLVDFILGQLAFMKLC